MVNMCGVTRAFVEKVNFLVAGIRSKRELNVLT